MSKNVYISMVNLLLLAVFISAQTNLRVSPQLHYSKSDEPLILPNTKALVSDPSQIDEFGYWGYNRVFVSPGDSGGYIRINSQESFNQNFDGSIEMWIYPFSLSGTRQLMGKGYGQNVQFMWGLNGSLQYFRIGMTTVTQTSGSPVTLNRWTHIAVTWTGGNPYTIRFYVNGSLSGQPLILNNAWVSNTDQIRICGNSGNLNSSYYNGKMDEVRFWDTQRTEMQIRENRFIGICDEPGSNLDNAVTSALAYSGLIASWTFNWHGGEELINGYSAIISSPASPEDAKYNSAIPYNLALKCPGVNVNSRVNIPHINLLNQALAGTVDTWINPRLINITKIIVCKGNSPDVSFAFGLSNNGKLFAQIGTVKTINNSGPSIQPDQWTHVACSWQKIGTAYEIKFFINGKLSGTAASNTGIFNINSDPMTIGAGIAFPADVFDGYVDELRYWSGARTENLIKSYMFVSCRGLSGVGGLIGAWNFEGNLLNRNTTVTGINGSFNTGGNNDCRFSGFLNETQVSNFGDGLEPHTTVINRRVTGNPFPLSFYLSFPNKPIADHQIVRDTLVLFSSNVVSVVELFLSVRHHNVSDLSISLTSPNGRRKNITSGNGGFGNDILTFFMDFEHPVTDINYLPPWSNLCGVEEEMYSFDNSNIQGKWVLEIRDSVSGNFGSLLGWGLRFNNSIGIQQTSTNIPSEFKLNQNFPNPFNPKTVISFQLAARSLASIKIFDILGREMTTLVNEDLQPGSYDANWDASNYPSGVYFYQLTVSSEQLTAYKETKKMVLVK